MIPDRPEYTATLLARQQLTPNVFGFRFSRPPGFAFQAGQFIQFKIPQPDDFVWRSYSIASAPSADYLDFCVKIIPGGKASDFFLTLAVGSETSFIGPNGFFISTPTAEANKIFIGTGTGLAPLISILADRIPQKIAGEKYSLIFGVRTEQDLFWQDRLQALALESTQFSFATTLTQPQLQNQNIWSGLTGRVIGHIPVTSEPADYYLCGSLEMIKDVRTVLLYQKVPMKQIHFEIY